MVLIVVSIVSMAALNFSESMLIAHETSRLDSQRFQARMMVESGIQTARVYVASTPAMRLEMGGDWDNPQKFQAINIVPSPDPVFRGNVTFIAPSLDQTGVISGFRYGLQNESAKLNLNALVAIDKLASSMNALAGAAGAAAGGAGGNGGSGGQSSGGSGQGGSTQGSTQGNNTQGGNNQTQGGSGQTQNNQGNQGGNRGGFGGGGFGGGGGGFGSGGGFGNSLGSLASSAGATTQGFGSRMLLGLPGMTEDVADAILDFIDEDEDVRPYGAEYADYYQQLNPGYRPLNGPLTSIEQLLLVRGVTPQLLYGYDQNRNGYIDASEQNQMIMGGPVGGAAAGSVMPQQQSSSSSSGSGNDQSITSPPSPLGWAPYLTLHSQEKNVAADGTKRVNINGDDLQKLYDDLKAAGINELHASYIIGYRIGGQPPAGAGSPLQTLLTAAAASSGATDGMLGAQLSAMGNSGGGNRQQMQLGATQSSLGTTLTPTGQGNQQKQLWTSSALDSLDLSQQTGSVKFNQILDLVDSTVTLGGQRGGQQGGTQQGSTQQGNNGQSGQGQNPQQPQPVFASPITGSPLSLADALPTLMDKLTTVDAEALPGRINIMHCPREILAGIPGMNSDLLEKILQARVDGSESDNRKHETWLAVEGLVTIDQMRGFLPLMTCGGDVFRGQVIGYFEGSAPYCRAEVIINGVGATPIVQFYRRLDHFGRGFDVMTLGQRNDVGLVPSTIKR